MKTWWEFVEGQRVRGLLHAESEFRRKEGTVVEASQLEQGRYWVHFDGAEKAVLVRAWELEEVDQ